MIAVKSPTLLGNYSLIWSGDPALNLPEYVDDPALDEEANKAARKTVDEERERILRVARQTGNWHSIIKPGQQPTVFTFRNLSLDDHEWINGLQQRKDLTDLEVVTRTFRLALVKVDNLGAVKVEREEVEGMSLATTEVTNTLYVALDGDVRRLFFLLVEFVAHINARVKRLLDPL